MTDGTERPFTFFALDSDESLDESLLSPFKLDLDSTTQRRVKRDKKEKDESLKRFLEWLQFYKITSQELSKRTGYTRGSIDAVRQGRRTVSVKLARSVASVDAELEPNPDKRIRWEYLIGMDDYRDNEALHEAAINAALDAAQEEDNKSTAWTWIIHSAGYDLEKQLPSPEGLNQFLLNDDDTGAPVRLITETDLQSIMSSIVDYAKFAVSQFIKNTEPRKGLVFNGINAETENEGRKSVL